MPDQSDSQAISASGSARPSLLLASAIAIALLAGCSKKPGGQVIAVVNGEEITQQEIRAEADAAGVPAGQDMQAITPQILQRVIERNLLAGYAHDQGLDKGPEYVARRRQMEQSLLATLALRKIAGPKGPPSTADIQNYIKQNPSLFAARERLTLDQVRFPTPSDTTRIKQLDALGSIDAIQARLKADGVQAGRANTVLDTGTIDPQVSQQITRLPNGNLFDLSVNGVTVISAITGRTSAPTPQAQWNSMASNLLQRSNAQKAAGDAMAKLRKDAKIDYDPAFKPKT